MQKTKKPFVSQVNRRKRVEHRHWTVERWERVIWSDESPFHLRCNNNQYVWRSPNEKISPRCLQETVKHDKKNYGMGMLFVEWRWLFLPCERNNEKEQYRQILIHHMRPSPRLLNGNDFIFQHDNDPKHSSNLVKNYLQNQGIEVLS